jgi:hypothetical protein
MSEAYKKLTKEDIDFPRYCLFFIKKLQEAIDGNDFEEDKAIEVSIDSTFRYCSDAFELITKTFERKGLFVSVPTFRLVMEDNVKHYIYKWKFQRYVNYDDLPF